MSDCVTIVTGFLTGVALAFALLYAPSAWSQEPTQKQLDYQMLNQWRKEIVQLQYSDFCASVRPLSPAAMQVLKQVIEQGKEAKHPVATELETWFESIMEKYAEKGCGDA